LSDCQFEHVAMTFCEVPFEKAPIAVVCAVSPFALIASASTDNVTDCNVCELDVGGGVGGEVEGPVGEDDLPSQAAKETPRTKTKRTRFMGKSLACVPGCVCIEGHRWWLVAISFYASRWNRNLCVRCLKGHAPHGVTSGDIGGVLSAIQLMAANGCLGRIHIDKSVPPNPITPFD
jgi:hypothetical protein